VVSRIELAGNILVGDSKRRLCKVLRPSRLQLLELLSFVLADDLLFAHFRISSSTVGTCIWPAEISPRVIYHHAQSGQTHRYGITGAAATADCGAAASALGSKQGAPNGNHSSTAIGNPGWHRFKSSRRPYVARRVVARHSAGG
jgi:hypothetical protein